MHNLEWKTCCMSMRLAERGQVWFYVLGCRQIPEYGMIFINLAPVACSILADLHGITTQSALVPDAIDSVNITRTQCSTQLQDLSLPGLKTDTHCDTHSEFVGIHTERNFNSKISSMGAAHSVPSVSKDTPVPCFRPPLNCPAYTLPSTSVSTPYPCCCSRAGGHQGP